MISVALTSLDVTERVAAAFRRHLTDGDVVLLRGDVGAGKTTFVGALARALDALEPARSPTYTIAHSYALADGGVLSHLDLYRQADAMSPAAWADLEPAFDATVTCIEWPEVAEPLLADRPTWILQLAIATADCRLLRLTAPDPERATALATELAAALAATSRPATPGL